MTDGKREKRLHLDMDFREAVERFAQVDPDELPEKVKLRRAKRKKAGSAKPPARKSEPKTKPPPDRNR